MTLDYVHGRSVICVVTMRTAVLYSTTVHHRTRSWHTSTHFTRLQPLSLSLPSRSKILHYYILLGLPSGRFSIYFSIKILCAYLSSSSGLHAQLILTTNISILLQHWAKCIKFLFMEGVHPKMPASVLISTYLFHSKRLTSVFYLQKIMSRHYHKYCQDCNCINFCSVLSHLELLDRIQN